MTAGDPALRATRTTWPLRVGCGILATPERGGAHLGDAEHPAFPDVCLKGSALAKRSVLTAVCSIL